jgi:hypothetical protein
MSAQGPGRFMSGENSGHPLFSVRRKTGTRIGKKTVASRRKMPLSFTSANRA